MQRLRLQLYDLNYGAIQIILLIYLLTYVTAMECHLPYGITQSYLPPDTMS